MNRSNLHHDDTDPSLANRAFALLLHLLPHHLLSQLVYWLTRSRWPLLKNWLIRSVVNLYRVDMQQAAEPELEHYASFNHFFTRALAPEMRPVAGDTNAVASPVDGAVSQCGPIIDGRIFQAKGQSFSLEELLGGDRQASDAFAGGSFATLYLSPRDYHRIHMPLAGRLQKMSHIPGRLFSVSPATTRVVPRLFARNERVVNLFQSEAGAMAVVMVGAIFVSSMDTVWAGTITPASRRISQWRYGADPAPAVELDKGDEMGRFNMGSTVLLLFAKGAVEWQEWLRPGTRIEMGQQIGTILPRD